MIGIAPSRQALSILLLTCSTSGSFIVGAVAGHEAHIAQIDPSKRGGAQDRPPHAPAVRLPPKASEPLRREPLRHDPKLEPPETSSPTGRPSIDKFKEKPALWGRRLDLNTATSAELRSVLGIGEEEARRIIDNRPYQKSDELVSRGVLARDQFEDIEASVTVRAPREDRR